jgi:predicted CoA-substrate-specific enzyme activase
MDVVQEIIGCWWFLLVGADTLSVERRGIFMGYDVGIDVGSVSINGMVIDDQRKVIYETPYVRHFGQVYEETWALLKRVIDRFGVDQIRSTAFTGVHGHLLSEIFAVPYEVESISQVLGATQMVPGVRSIISIGGQDAALFQLAYQGEQWQLESFNMNGPCASGTGSFIDQQAERLASSIYGTDFHLDQERVQHTLEDFIALGLQSASPAAVACRCTVFTKSDMIHLQNKGEPLPNIIAGLHYGNAANYMSTIVANRELLAPIIFIGGMASNPLQVTAFQHYFPQLVVPRHHTSLGALGVAIQAQKQGWKQGIDWARLDHKVPQAEMAFPRAPRLELRHTHFDGDNSLPAWGAVLHRPVEAFLGIDIGSTTTKYALIDAGGKILHKCYVQTQGKPIEITQKLLGTLEREVGERVRLLSIATTGSGRNVVGDFLDADLVIDEITAHARGAVAVDPAIDTVFEIGGQDSKYIRIDRTHPLDFDMNKVCAAGTGSFLHELANKLKINIVGEFQEVALASQDPIHLAERCTVFMESDLVSYAQKGAARQDLIAGLCYAIVHNYLNRVVGRRRIGQRIMFLGGPSLNQGIVAAFERVLDRPLVVPRHREVMGAYGAALAVLQAFQRGEVQQRVRKLAKLAQLQVQFTETVCRADKKCHNECKLKTYDFGGRKSIWGGECGRYEVGHASGLRQPNLFQERQQLFQEALEGKAVRLGEPQEVQLQGPRAATIGIPQGLHALDWGVFWVHLMAELGFQVLLSPSTNNRLALSGVECMTAETCFPVKVFHGHVRYLLDKADFLFLPNVINMPTPEPDDRGLFCPLVESSQFMVRAALQIPAQRMIRPTLYLKDGPDALLDDLLRGFPPAIRPQARFLKSAVGVAWEKQHQFRERVKQRGKEVLEGTSADEPVWVVSGRSYNLYDERLNLQLGRQFARLGIRALPMDYLDLDAEDLSDFPRMYWGLGARILRTAKRIARTPNFYGVHLTNFSCGADSFLEHFYQHILHDKPSLILELDEHSAVAGLLTRIEAYRNVVKNIRQMTASDQDQAMVGLKVSSR